MGASSLAMGVGKERSVHRRRDVFEQEARMMVSRRRTVRTHISNGSGSAPVRIINHVAEGKMPQSRLEKG